MGYNISSFSYFKLFFNAENVLNKHIFAFSDFNIVNIYFSECIQTLEDQINIRILQQIAIN